MSLLLRGRTTRKGRTRVRGPRRASQGLAENDISRRQAIKWAGYSVLGATLSSMGFAETAEGLTARQRRRCRNHGGVPLEKGNCHCAGICGRASSFFNCQNNANCFCVKTTEGKGFCINNATNCQFLKACSRSSQCNPGQKCVVRTCCRGSVCAPPCPGPASSAQQPTASRGSGLLTPTG